MHCGKCGAQMLEGSTSCSSCGGRTGSERSGAKTGHRNVWPKTKEEFRQGRKICLVGFSLSVTAVAAGVSGYVALGYVLVVAAVAVYIFGAYNWAKYKGRSPWFCLWGLIAPIGLLVVVFLEDKWRENTGQDQAGQAR